MPVTTPPSVTFTDHEFYLEFFVTCPGMSTITVDRVFDGQLVPIDTSTTPLPANDRWRGYDPEVPSGESTYQFTAYGSSNTVSVVSWIHTFERPLDYFYNFALAPDTGMYLYVESYETQRRAAVGRQVLNVLHRNDPVVVTYGRSMADGELDVLTLTDIERRWMEQFLDTQQLLVFQPVANAHTSAPKYLAVGDVEVERTTKYVHEDSRRFKLTINEVARPKRQVFVSLPPMPSQHVWLDVEQMGTWGTVKATGQTWWQLAGYTAPPP